MHAEVIPLRCNFVHVKRDIQHILYSRLALLFIVLIAVGCSTYKSQLHDAKEYEEARMYSKALSLYSELLVKKESKEALLGKKRVVEAMVMENYDGPIRMLCMQEKINDAERLYSELSVFIEKNSALDVKEPYGLPLFIHYN